VQKIAAQREKHIQELQGNSTPQGRNWSRKGEKGSGRKKSFATGALLTER